MRCTFYIINVFILLSIILFTAKSADPETVEVTTRCGRVKGSIVKSRLGKTIFSFRGIYYAEAPVGKERFKQAMPVQPWADIFDATKEGPSCIQDIGVDMSENCLVLNVYTKQVAATDSAEKLPVIVWIHPGGLQKMSSQSFLYGPKYLLDQDIVLVSINYRLASLGFLNTGEAHAPGNFGLKDQVEALRWIQQNIAAFGGDPNSVTLAGQSGGARAITAHLVSPMSKNLFHRAIVMSGSSTTPIHPQKEQMDVAVKQAKILNCPSDNLDSMLACLRDKPADEFGKTVSAFVEWHGDPIMVWYAAIEQDYPDTERFLPDDIETLMKSGAINSVPLIIGVTRDEFSFKSADALKQSLEGNNEIISKFNKEWESIAPICFQYERDTDRSKFISQELIKFYFNNESINVNNVDALGRLYANSLVHFPTYRTASLMAKYSSSPVYFYEFSYQSQYSTRAWSDSKKPKGGVAHGDDLQYIFNIENDIYGDTAEFPFYQESDPEIVIVKRMTSIWGNFAKTGEPISKDVADIFGTTNWEKFTSDNKAYLEIAQDLMIRNDFLAETMKLWDDLFP